MGFPKKKNNIEVYKQNYGVDRRVDMNNQITENDLRFPDGILHEDLDKGMLEFVKENINIVSNGKKIPFIDIIFSNQRWAEFTHNWEFVDKDLNIDIPFISLLRTPVMEYGKQPSLQWTIPNRKHFFYNSKPIWDGNQYNFEVYKIPQPVPVNINYELTIVCNSIRDINSFNKIILQTFTSRQAYTIIKGHYIPIILENIEDNSQNDLESRKFFMQTYKLTMYGLLLDPEEFEVKPGISRMLIVTDGLDLKKDTSIDMGVLKIKKEEATEKQTIITTKEPLKKVFSVMVNDRLLTENIDYFYMVNSSKITLNNELIGGEEIKVIYYKGLNNQIITENGDILNYYKETILVDKDLIKLSRKFNTLINISVNNQCLVEDVDYKINNQFEIKIINEDYINVNLTFEYLS